MTATMARSRVVTIGTRGSALALIQTDLVAAALRAHYPGLEVAVERITTRGDAVRDRSIRAAATNDRGLFIEEIEAALRDGRIDLAVHSAKDLPSRLPDDMRIAAYTERADPRDVLVSPHGALRDLPPGARVGTSSPRRTCQLRALRPDLAVHDIRGNVDTRLRKLGEGKYDAIVLAAAGLVRLNLEGVVAEWFSPAQFLPAVGQGALAVETRADDDLVNALLAPLNDAPTALALTAERAFLATVAGGCSAAVAAFAELTEIAETDTLTLTGLIGATDGTSLRAQRTGPVAEAAHLGADLATTLLAQGGDRLLAEDRRD